MQESYNNQNYVISKHSETLKFMVKIFVYVLQNLKEIKTSFKNGDEHNEDDHYAYEKVCIIMYSQENTNHKTSKIMSYTIENDI